MKADRETAFKTAKIRPTREFCLLAPFALAGLIALAFVLRGLYSGRLSGSNVGYVVAFLIGWTGLLTILGCWMVCSGRAFWYPPIRSERIMLTYAGSYRIASERTDRRRGVELHLQPLPGHPRAYPVRVVCTVRGSDPKTLATEELTDMLTGDGVYVTCLPGVEGAVADVYLEVTTETEPPAVIQVDRYAVFGTRRTWINAHGGFESIRGAGFGGP